MDIKRDRYVNASQLEYLPDYAMMPEPFQPDYVQGIKREGGNWDKRFAAMAEEVHKHPDMWGQLGIEDMVVQYNPGSVSIGGERVTAKNDIAVKIRGRWYIVDTKFSDSTKHSYEGQLFSQAKVLSQYRGVKMEEISAYAGYMDRTAASSVLNMADAQIQAKRQELKDTQAYDEDQIRQQIAQFSRETFVKVVGTLIVDPLVRQSTALHDINAAHLDRAASGVRLRQIALDDQAEKRTAQQVMNVADVEQAMYVITGMQPKQLFQAMKGYEKELASNEENLAREAFHRELDYQARMLVNAHRSNQDVDIRAIQNKVFDKLRLPTGRVLPMIPVQDPNAQPRQTGPAGLESGRSAPINVNGVWEPISLPGRQPFAAFNAEGEIRFLTQHKTEQAQFIPSASARVRKGPGGILIVNERVVPGGMEALSEIAAQMESAFVQGGGGWKGEHAAEVILRNSLEGKPYVPPGGMATTLESKIINLVDLGFKRDDNTGKYINEPIQRTYARLGSDIFVRSGNARVGYHAAPVLASVGGYMVEGSGADATVFMSGRDAKVIKDLQKYARENVLQFEGRQYTSPIRMAGQSRAESFTAMKTFMANVSELSVISEQMVRESQKPGAKGAAFLGTTPYYRRIPLRSDVHYKPEKATFDPRTKRLSLGTTNGSEPFFQEEDNWDDIRDVETKFVSVGGQRYIEVRGTGVVNPISTLIKNWGAEKALAPVGSVYGLEKEGVEYLSLIGASPRQNAYTFLHSYYRKNGGAPAIRADLVGLLEKNEDARKLIFGEDIDTKTAVERMQAEMGKTGNQDEFVWGTSKLVDRALYFLADEKSAPYVKVKTLTVPMTFMDYQKYRKAFGNKFSQDENTPGLVQVFEDEEKWSQNLGERRDVVMRVRGLQYEMGQLFAQPFARGRGRMSFEELLDVFKNPQGYSKAYADAIREKVLPRLAHQGGRARESSEAMLKAFIVSSGRATPDEFKMETITWADFQNAVYEYASEKKLAIRRDFFDMLRDPEFLKSKQLNGKYINMGSGFLMAPADLLAQFVTYARGEEPPKGSTQNLYTENAAQRKQMNAMMNIMRSLVEENVTDENGEMTEAFKTGRSKLEQVTSKVAGARRVVQNAMGLKTGAEGMYVMAPGVPMNQIALGPKTMKRLFGTTDMAVVQEAINQGRLLVMGLRRPGPDAKLNAATPLQVVRPEDLGFAAETEAFIVSSELGDIFQGDTDGDRMIAWALSMYKMGRETGKDRVVTDKELIKESSPTAMLDRLARSYSTLLGEKVEFKSADDYLDFTERLYRAQKNAKVLVMSEVGKSAAGIADQPRPGTGSFIGEFKQSEEDRLAGKKDGSWTAESKMRTLRETVMKAEGVGKQEMGFAYNQFRRNLQSLADAMGIGDDYRTRALMSRLGYESYQTSVDKEIFSKGLRTLIAIGNRYTMGQETIVDSLDPHMGTPEASGKISFWETGSAKTDLPREMIRAVLTAHEMRLGGANKRWTQDVATALTGDKAIGKVIETIISKNKVVAGVLERFNAADVVGRTELEKEFQEAINDQAGTLAEQLFNYAFGGKAANLMEGGGLVTTSLYSQILERANRKASSIGSTALVLGNFMRTRPTLANKLVGYGQRMQGWRTMVSGKGDVRQAYPNVRGASIIPDDAVMSDVARTAAKKAVDVVEQAIDQEGGSFFDPRQMNAQDKLAKINEFEAQLLQLVRDSDRPAGDWLPMLSNIAKTKTQKATYAKGMGEFLPADPNTPGPKFSELAADAQQRLTEMTSKIFKGLFFSVKGGVESMNEKTFDRFAMAFPDQSKDDIAAKIGKAVNDATAAKSQPDPNAGGFAHGPAIPIPPNSGSAGGGTPPPPPSGGAAAAAASGRDPRAGAHRTMREYDDQGQLISERVLPQMTPQRKYGSQIDDPDFLGRAIKGQVDDQTMGRFNREGSLDANLISALSTANKGKVPWGFLTQLRDIGGTTAMEGGTSPYDTILEGALSQKGVVAHQKEQDKREKDITKVLAKFGDSLELATKNVRNFDEAMDRVDKGGRLKPEEAERQKAALGLLGQASQAQKAFAALGLELPTELGKRVARYNAVVDRDQQALLDTGTGYIPKKGPASNAREAAAGWLGQFAPEGKGIFSGQIGEMYWGALNIHRAWNLTGGQVGNLMTNYAKWEQEQQRLGASLGEGVGFKGSSAMVGNTEAEMQRFMLGVGKAGWNTWGGPLNRAANLINGNNPESPSPLQNAIAMGTPIMGGLMTAAVTANTLKKWGAPDWLSGAVNLPIALPGKILGGLNKIDMGTTNLFGAATDMSRVEGAANLGATNTIAAPTGLAGVGGRAIPLTGLGAMGLAAGSLTAGALGGTELVAAAARRGVGVQGTLPIGLGFDPNYGQMSTMQRLGSAAVTAEQIATMPTMLAASAMQGLADKTGQQWLGAGARFAAGLAGNTVSTIKQWTGLEKKPEDMTPEEKELSKFSTFGDTMIKYNKALRPGEDRALAAQYAAYTGRSAGGMTGGLAQSESEAQELALTGTMTEPQREKAFGFMYQAGRASGLKRGEAGWEKYLGQYREALDQNPAMAQDAEESLQRAGGFFEMARQRGAKVPNISLRGLAGMSKQDQQLYERLGANDPMAWSYVAEQNGGAGESWRFQTMESDTGFAAGTTRYAPYLFSPAMMNQQAGYGQKFLTGEVNRLAQNGTVDLQGGTVKIGNDTIGLNMMSMQDEMMKLQREDQEFQVSQRGRQWGMEFLATTGGRGPGGQGGGALAQAAMGKASAGGGEYGFLLQGQTFNFKLGNQSAQIKMEGQGQWQFEDASKKLGRTYQGIQFGFQQEQLNLSDKQFRENLELNRGKFQWETNYQRQQMGIDYGRQKTQFGWQEQDLAYQGARNSLQYGWQMQDLQENLRYSTGRERRQLLRQEERATISYAMDQGHLSVEGDRLQQREKWAEEDFNRQRTYFEQRVQWTEQEFELQLKHHEESQDLSQRRLNTERDYFNATNQLQDKRIEVERKYYTEVQKSNLVMLNQSAQMVANTNTLNTLMTQTSSNLTTLQANWNAALSGTGTMFTAFQGFVDAVVKYLGQKTSALGGGDDFVGQPNPPARPSNTGPQE